MCDRAPHFRVRGIEAFVDQLVEKIFGHLRMDWHLIVSAREFRNRPSSSMMAKVGIQAIENVSGDPLRKTMASGLVSSGSFQATHGRDAASSIAGFSSGGRIIN
jgi:hypothetical protein